MTDLTALKNEAWKLHEMPAGLKGPEQLFFLELRRISADYRKHLIDEATLKKETAAAEAEFWDWWKKINDMSQTEAFWERVSRAAVEFARDYDMASADKFFRTVYDLPEGWHTSKEEEIRLI